MVAKVAEVEMEVNLVEEVKETEVKEADEMVEDWVEELKEED